MKNKRTFLIGAVTAVLIAVAAFGVPRFLPQRVDAFNPQPDPPGYGMIGITEGQTLRISVVNTAPVPTESNVPPDPVRVVIMFRDASGNLLVNAGGTPIQRAALLNGGQSVALNLNADNFSRFGQRMEVRPDVRIQEPDGVNGVPPDPVIPTAEVINNLNGRTQFVLPHVSAPRAALPQ
jgi:hypothetical protein